MNTRGRVLGYLLVAVVALGLIGWLTARYLVKRQLLRDLGSRNMQDRVDAARSLLEMEKLEDALPAQPIIIRSKTAQALGEIGSDRALRLLGVILKDQEEAPRRWARQALVKQGTAAVPIFMKALSASGGTLEEAIAGLQEIGMAAAPQMRILLSDRGAYKGASQALSKMGRIGVDALLIACYASDADLRAQALGDLAKQKVRAELPAALHNLGKGLSQAAGISALGELGDPNTVPAILPFLKKPDNRGTAATALGMIGDARAVQPILDVIPISVRSDREAEIVALRRIVRRAGPLALPPLIRDLTSPRSALRRAAAAALVGGNLPALNGPLAAALRDPDEQVRASAALALGWRGNLAGIQPLVGALADPQWRVVTAAVNSLSAIGTAGMGQLLAVVTRSANTTVNYQITEAFVGMGRPAVPSLISALSHPSPEVQKWAAVALGELRDQRSVAPLQRLAKTARGDLRWVVEEQLRVLAGPTGS